MFSVSLIWTIWSFKSFNESLCTVCSSMEIYNIIWIPLMIFKNNVFVQLLNYQSNHLYINYKGFYLEIIYLLPFYFIALIILKRIKIHCNYYYYRYITEAVNFNLHTNYIRKLKTLRWHYTLVSLGLQSLLFALGL